MNTRQGLRQAYRMASKMKINKDPGNNFQYNARGTPDPVYTQHFKIENKGSTTYIKINDYMMDAYMHITKVNKRGFHKSIALNSEEMFNLFDVANSEKFRAGIEACIQKITTHYGVLPGTQKEEIEYETIPKSVRALEMQKNAEAEFKKQKFFDSKYEELLEEYEKKKEAENRTKKKRKASAPAVNKNRKKKKVQEEEEEEDDDDDEEEEEDEDSGEDNEEEET